MIYSVRGIPGGEENGVRGYMLTYVIAYIRVSVVGLMLVFIIIYVVYLYSIIYIYVYKHCNIFVFIIYLCIQLCNLNIEHLVYQYLYMY